MLSMPRVGPAYHTFSHLRIFPFDLLYMFFMLLILHQSCFLFWFLTSHPTASEEVFFFPWFHSYVPARGYKQQSSCLRRASTQISIITTAKPAKLGALTLRKPLLRLHKYTHCLLLSVFLCLCLCGFISGFPNQLGHF